VGMLGGSLLTRWKRWRLTELLFFQVLFGPGWWLSSLSCAVSPAYSFFQRPHWVASFLMTMPARKKTDINYQGWEACISQRTHWFYSQVA